MCPQMHLSEHFLSTSVCTVLGSRWKGKLQLGENPQQETESAKSGAGKIGLEVVLGAGKEEGGLVLGGVGRPADTCSISVIAPLSH